MNALFLLTCAALAADAQPRATVLVVVGAPGTEKYDRQFHQWAARWQAAAERGNAECHTIGLEESGEKSDRKLLAERISEHAISSPQPLWLVLIGHGTFDGKTARFNLRGPDVTPDELGKWLGKADRPLAIVNCASGSAPFLAKLTGNNRVVISATKSGFEYNFARFGDYLSAAIADPRADLDKDDQTSLLEAFLQASAGVKEFYAADGRLETEHALIDDNGDGLGTPADWFQGVRAVKMAKDGAAPDGTLAQQVCLIPSRREQELSPEIRARRDELERELAAVRQRKGELAEEEYLKLLEPILLQIARLYETESRPSPNPSASP
ncbi:MAG TPA: hypothetical protein VMP01_06415 [Pirellulaceae bacterium]|nr:hypothetical protein [Pirellulaceae bacterium]